MSSHCPNRTKILNPKSGRMVLECGKIGQQIIATATAKKSTKVIKTTTKKQNEAAKTTINFIENAQDLPARQLKQLKSMMFADCFESETDLYIGNHLWYVANAHNKIIACLFLDKKSASIAFAFNLCTSTAARGQGYMKELLRFAKACCKKNKVRFMTLSVLKSNKTAIHLYETQGFKTTGEGKTTVANGDREGYWEMKLKL
jgi:ribosomal protein S18 acetylase RimI-like enzyme